MPSQIGPQYVSLCALFPQWPLLHKDVDFSHQYKQFIEPLSSREIRETFQEHWGRLKRDEIQDCHGEDGILGAYREYTTWMRFTVQVSQHILQEWGVFKCLQWSGQKGNHFISPKIIKQIKMTNHYFFYKSSIIAEIHYEVEPKPGGLVQCMMSSSMHQHLFFTTTKLLLKQHGFQEFLTISCLLLMQQHRNKTSNTATWIMEFHITDASNEGPQITLTTHTHSNKAGKLKLLHGKK